MRLKKVFKKEQGFTILEVMIVLVVIMVIIAIGVGGYRIVQEVSRDTQRRALVRDVQLALESHNEKTNSYPATGELSLTVTEDHVAINAGGEKLDSAVNFEIGKIEDAGCEAGEGQMNVAESDSGYFSYCYVGETKGYRLVVLLERSKEPYDAGNVPSEEE